MTAPDPERVARQHAQHGAAKRKSRMYYMRHRSAIKRRSKTHYRRVHNTGAFRTKARHRRLHPGQHRRLHAAELDVQGLCLPVWSPSYGDGDVVNVSGSWVGFLPDTAPDDADPTWVPYPLFLADAVFLNGDSDIDLFFEALDGEMGVEGLVEDVDEDPALDPQ